MKLFHVADVHLGRRRLDGRLPDSDLAEAFSFVARKAVEERVDVFLIAGDLFDRPTVDPPNLRQAQQVLGFLKENGIPVLAIEGNHDRAFIHSEETTWMQFLAEDDLLVLLRVTFDSAGPILTSWDPARKTGSWIDYGGIRFVGAGYLGAATPFKVRQIVSRLESDRTHVLMLHAGPDYFVGEGGGFSESDLWALNEKVCYLALGHIHHPMRHGDWACNPGSLENCDLSEGRYDRYAGGVALARGYAVLEIDPAQRQKPIDLRIRSNPRRDVHRITLDCCPFGNKTKDGAAALIKESVRLIRAAKVAPQSVIDLRLIGRLNLNRISFDQALAASEIESQAEVFAVAFDLAGLEIGGSSAETELTSKGISREQLERDAIREVAASKDLSGIEHREDEFAGFCYELKQAVRQGKSGPELAELIGRSPLLDLLATSNPAKTDRRLTQEVLENFA
ncbi:MAG: metallophosphoesterase [Verrucomicrobia bacterium]|nr:metallophosphoesterase [Verrucomicrobiota bacterium]